ncbi:MAG: SOS response-associated peptidase [Gammaproteobacteria bacterium]|nr:SOS response-associated peptidase [Gammaproteobacteria bacterium]
MADLRRARGVATAIASAARFGHSTGMCGRFNVIDSPGLQQLLRDLGIDLQLPQGVNLAPTEQVYLVRELGQRRVAQPARWWLTPSWAKEVSQKYAMFNARSETLTSSPAFRHPFRSQRGLVPMSSFIEWRVEGGVKQPWLITTEQEALAVAALWDVWEGGDTPLLSCTLVTTAAARAFEPWHKRMPVLLAPDEYERWLDPGREIAPSDPVFRSELKLGLRLQRLSRVASDARNKDPQAQQGEGELIELPADTPL